MKLTAAQRRKLESIAEAGETRNPGNLSTTYALVARGLVEAEKRGTFPHAHMVYRATDQGREVLSPGAERDGDRDHYASLADEMNDYDVAPWNEDDWDADAVAGAKRYAAAHGLRFPPQTGDYDRFYERER